MGRKILSLRWLEQDSESEHDGRKRMSLRPERGDAGERRDRGEAELPPVHERVPEKKLKKPNEVTG